MKFVFLLVLLFCFNFISAQSLTLGFLKHDDSNISSSFIDDLKSELNYLISDKKIEIIHLTSVSDAHKNLRNIDYYIIAGKDYLINIHDFHYIDKPVISTEILFERLLTDKLSLDNLYIFRYNVDDLEKYINVLAKFSQNNIVNFIVPGSFIDLNDAYEQFTKQIKSDKNITVNTINVNDDLNIIKNNIMQNKDFVYIFDRNYHYDKVNAIIDFCLKNNIPAYTVVSDHKEAANFLLYKKTNTYKEITRKIAVLINNIERNLPVNLTDIIIHDDFYFNNNIAQKINFMYPHELFPIIRVIEQDDVSVDILSLKDGLKMIINENKQIESASKQILINQLQKNITKSNYYPNVSLGGSHFRTQSDISRSSFGLIPEHKTNLTVGVQTVIFNDKLNALSKIDDKNIEISNLDKKNTVNNVLNIYGNLYFQLLKLNELRKINSHNIERIKSNLNHSETGHRIGNIQKEEVLRWRAELGKNKAELIDIDKNISALKQTINVLLDRPVDYNFKPKSIHFENPVFFKSVISIINTHSSFNERNKLRNYLIDVAFKNNFTLSTINKYINMKNIEYKTVSREYYIPEVSAGIEYEYVIDERRHSPLKSLSDALSSHEINFSLPETDEHNFTGMIKFSLPLFDGFRKRNQLEKITNEIEILENKKYLLKQRITNDITRLVNEIYYIHSQIRWTQYTRNSSQDAYNRIRSKYEAGVIGITTLIDIQQTLLISENYNIITEFDFFSKLFEIHYYMNTISKILEPDLFNEIWNF